MSLKYHDGIAYDPVHKVWRLRLWVDGRNRKGSYATKMEVERARAQIRARRTARTLGLPDPLGADPYAMTLAEAFDHRIEGLKKRRRAELTIAQMEQHRALWVAWGGPARPAALSTTDLEDFHDWYRLRAPKSRGGMAAKSIMIVRGVLKRVGLPVPPDLAIDVPKRAPRTVPKDQLLRFLAAMRLGTVERTFAELVLRTNGRESELRRLTAGDVDLPGRRLLLSRRKGGTHEKWVPVSAALVAVLRAYLASQPRLAPQEPFLALGDPRRALDRLSLRKRLWAACGAAGMPKKGGLGWLRHEAVTLLRETGESLARVTRGSGHSGSRLVAAHYDESSRRAAEEWRTRRELGARLDRLVPISRDRSGTNRAPSSPRSATRNTRKS